MSIVSAVESVIFNKKERKKGFNRFKVKNASLKM